MRMIKPLRMACWSLLPPTSWASPSCGLSSLTEYHTKSTSSPASACISAVALRPAFGIKKPFVLTWASSDSTVTLWHACNATASGIDAASVGVAADTWVTPCGFAGSGWIPFPRPSAGASGGRGSGGCGRASNATAFGSPSWLHRPGGIPPEAKEAAGRGFDRSSVSLGRSQLECVLCERGWFGRSPPPS